MKTQNYLFSIQTLRDTCLTCFCILTIAFCLLLVCTVRNSAFGPETSLTSLDSDGCPEDFGFALPLLACLVFEPDRSSNAFWIVDLLNLCLAHCWFSKSVQDVGSSSPTCWRDNPVVTSTFLAHVRRSIYPTKFGQQDVLEKKPLIALHSSSTDKYSCNIS